MVNEVVTGTHIIYILMIMVGVIGVLAKAVNQVTLRRAVRAAANMSKSTHKLMKLVRSKYEHACMLHDKVENTEAFVEKYIYEYRGVLFKVHTWKQLERQSVWGAGILAMAGAVAWYMKQGFCDAMYRYIALGLVEMLLLYVVGQLSDETYKIEAIKNYMVDYLENVCAFRYRKVRQSEREQIDVIQPEASQQSRREEAEPAAEEAPGLSINIEGTPRKVPKSEAARQLIRRASRDRTEDQEEPALREDAIRQILEEFLA